VRAAAAALLLAGCTTSVSTLQTARVLDPRQVQITAALEGSLHSAALAEPLEAADRLADELDRAEETGETISEALEREAIEAALGLTLFTPSVAPVFIGRVGVGHGAEVGLRYTGALVGAEGKVQLARAEPESGVDLALFGGAAHHLDTGSSFASGLFDLLSTIDVADYARNDLHLGLILGRDFGRWLSLYTSARYMASFWSLRTDFGDIATESGVEDLDLDGTIHALGGAGGLFVGYAHVFVNLELTVMRVWFAPEVLGETRDLDGWAVAPSFGLTLRF
jgi:hypothetical protein